MSHIAIAPYITSHRIGKAQTDEVGRSSFERDADRILFCEAFRALANKTQVYTMKGDDYIRSRLTHSLEVSRVGRSLGHRLGQRMRLGDFTPADISHIISAACLMHDIGNPPFGHLGEKIVADFFRFQAVGKMAISGCTPIEQAEFKSLDGNAQGFRMMTRLQGWREAGGLSLTASTLAAAAKYPWAVDSLPPEMEKPKYNFFHADATTFAEVAASTHMIQEADHRWRRHPLAYLVEAADDIAYLVVDIEDAVHLDVLTLAQAEDMLLPLLPLHEHPSYAEVTDPQRKLVYLRAKAIGGLVDALAENWSEAAPLVVKGEHPGDLLDHTAPGDHIQNLRRFSREMIYKTQESMGIQPLAETLLYGLLTQYVENLLAKEEGRLYSPAAVQGLENLPLERALWLRGVVDHICAMTDTQVQREAQRLKVV